MAWEMQNHMVGSILPSVEAYLAGEGDPRREAFRILTHLFPDGETTDGETRIQGELARLGLPWATQVIADAAEREATTTNGGWEFYVDSEGWVSIPWKEEDADGEAN